MAFLKRGLQFEWKLGELKQAFLSRKLPYYKVQLENETTRWFSEDNLLGGKNENIKRLQR